MKRSWKFVLLWAAAAAAVATAAFAAGGEGDPLITLSYLKNVFTGQVQTMVDETVSKRDAQLKNDMDQAISDWETRIKGVIAGIEAGAEQESVLFKSVSFGKGQSLKCAAGTELVIRSGSAAADADLLDQTDGVTLAKGETLKADHLYLAVSACIVSLPEAPLTGTVNDGPLNVRTGAGSGYKILGTLAAGTTVTILGTNGSWYQVRAGSLTGYVSAVYITLNASGSAGSVTALARGSVTVSG